MDLNLVSARLAGAPANSYAIYEYLVGAGGLFAYAEDARMAARVPVAGAQLRGLEPVAPEARLKVARISVDWLWSVLGSARRHLPNERAFQFLWNDAGQRWRCDAPMQTADSVSVSYADLSGAVVDLHSHGALPAFFSNTDDADEQGLRFYVVIGRVDTDRPTITARVGVYGHMMPVPAWVIFDGYGPFVEADKAETGAA